MAERSRDWMRQAESDLRHAGHARDDADFDWAAFASHQAAEKAVKALFQVLHLDAWGQTVTTLITSLPAGAAAPPDLVPMRARSSTSSTFRSAIPTASSEAHRSTSTPARRRRPHDCGRGGHH